MNQLSPQSQERSRYIIAFSILILYVPKSYGSPLDE